MLNDIYDMIVVNAPENYDKILNELDKAYYNINALHLDFDLTNKLSDIITDTNKTAFIQGFKCAVNLIEECKN